MTDVPYWIPGAGHRSRIGRLVAYLSSCVDLTVVFIGDSLPFGGGVPEVRMELLDTRGFPNARDIGEAFAAVINGGSGCFCIIEYFHLAYLSGYLPEDVRTLLDIHDIGYQRAGSFGAYGREDPFGVDRELELEVYGFFDKVIVLSETDKEELGRWLPQERLVVAPHAPVLSRKVMRDVAGIVGFVGSEYPANIDAMEFFVSEVWPLVKAASSLELHIYGNVGRHISGEDIRVRGYVPEIDMAYDEMDIAINPVRFGAGLKIKNIEAMGYGMPLMTTGHGARGLEKEAGHCFVVADGCEEMAGSLLRLARDRVYREEIAGSGYEMAARCYTPDKCYAALAAALG